MTNTRNEIILHVESLTKKFGGLVALNSLSFHVHRNEVLGVIGPNGSGKTTLFNVITGRYTADEGKIIFNGEYITNRKTHEIIEKGIGRTHQATTLFFNLSVLNNMMIAQHIQLRNIKQDREKKAMELLGLFRLDHVKDKIAHNITHAEQRRLMIAMAMASGPALILLDEPTAGMTAEETNELMGMLQQIREKGTTILLIEHNMRVAMKFSERIVVLNYGAKIAEGAPHEVSKNKAVIEAYLGSESYARGQ